MNKLQYFILALLLFMMGILFFFYQQSWIIISLPKQNCPETSKILHAIKPQKVELWAFKQQRWICETAEIIKNDNHAQTVQLLLNSWFLFLEEEQLIEHQITVQSVILTPSGHEAFISLNQSPLNQQSSTHEAYMLIESLLKTIRLNHIPIQSVRFLVHHHPLQDQRLNFSISWPLTGYMDIK